MISDELRLEDGASPSQMKSPPLFRLNLTYRPPVRNLQSTVF